MPRHLVTPSLYSGWSYYRSAETQTKQDFLNVLNKVPFVRSEDMIAGINFEDDVMALINNTTPSDNDDDWLYCCAEVATIIRGGLFQERLYKSMTIGKHNILLYGRADAVKRSYCYDIKYTSNYDLGKYSDSIQHDTYMFCGDIPNFEYLVSNGRYVWKEYYRQTAESVRSLEYRIHEMLEDITADPDFNAAFIANWSSHE